MSQDHFVENFLQEAARYDEELAVAIKTLQITKLPVHLPYIPNSALNCQRIFETFGIKQRSRAAELSLLLQDIYGIQPADPELTAPAESYPAERTVKPGQGSGVGRGEAREQARTRGRDSQAAASNNVKKNKSKAKNQLRKTKDLNPPAKTDATRKGSPHS